MLSQKTYVQKTRSVVFFSNLIHEPFSSLYPILPFILIKNYQAAALQIVLLTMLKPIASIFSFYWSELISQKRHTLRRNLLGAGLMARLPFVVAIFFDNVWLLIAASTLYMLFTRAGIPAWMEILKLNLPGKLREKYFAIGSAIGYAEGVFIAIGVGSLLDYDIHLWRHLFLIALALGLLGVLTQVLLPIQKKEIEQKGEKKSLKENFLRPWQDCLHLMRTRPDFRRFQWAFMICGFGLMILQPVIPIFFSENLHLSCRDIMIAFSICKGLGFVLTSPLWSRSMSTLSVGRFTAFVLIGFGLYASCLVFGIYSSIWIYLSYFIYGIAQAGSHLIWHMSGPIFSESEDSSRYSGVSVVLVGVRGMLGPPLGGLLSLVFGPLLVIYFSIVLCLGAIFTVSVRAPTRLTLPA